MTWDIALNNRHTLRGGIVTGDDEILQRLWIRLNRELGEWFLNTDVGLPWYQGGYGMLGAKPSRKNEIDLLIRQEIAQTNGVVQILKYQTLYATGTRLYDAYCSILLPSNRTVDINFGVSMESGGSGMPVIPASFIRFESGKTLQDLYDSGELQGPAGLPGTPGADGQAATIAVGTTSNLPFGSDAVVENVGDETHAILNFGLPQGSPGADGVQATISIGTTTTGVPGSDAVVTNTGTETAAVLDFVIPRGQAGTDGTDGVQPTITVGTTTTGEPGTVASVTNVGTDTDAVLNFVIPKGADGTAASVTIDGGTTLNVTETVEGGTTKFTLAVVDNAHGHTVDNVTGLQSTLDGKLGPTTVTLSGDVTGSATLDGDAEVTITTTTDGGLIK